MTAFPDPVTADPLARRGRTVTLVLWGVVAGSSAALLVFEVTAALQGDDAHLWARLAGSWESLVLLAVGIVGGAILFTGLPWTRWATAAAFGAGAMWNVLWPEAQAALLAIIGTSVVWAAAAVTLTAWRGIAAFQARQLEANYERLMGPLRSREDARRWLETTDRWSEAGAVTRGVLDRIAHLMVHRMAELELPLGELDQPIAALCAASNRKPLRLGLTNVRRLAGALRRVTSRGSASPRP
jgi:hypothetical protein